MFEKGPHCPAPPPPCFFPHSLPANSLSLLNGKWVSGHYGIQFPAQWEALDLTLNMNTDKYSPGRGSAAACTAHCLFYLINLYENRLFSQLLQFLFTSWISPLASIQGQFNSEVSTFEVSCKAARKTPAGKLVHCVQIFLLIYNCDKVHINTNKSSCQNTRTKPVSPFESRPPKDSSILKPDLASEVSDYIQPLLFQFSSQVIEGKSYFCKR